MGNQTIKDLLKDVKKDITQFISDQEGENLRIDKLNVEIKELNQKLDKYEKGLGGVFHTQKIDGIQAKLKSLYGDLSEAKAQKETIEKKLDNAKSQRNFLAVLGTIRTGIPNRINKVKRGISEYKVELKRIQNEFPRDANVNNSSIICREVISDLENQAANLEKLKPKIDQLVSDRQLLRNQFVLSLDEITNTSNLTTDKLIEIINKLELINTQLEKNLAENQFGTQFLAADNLLGEVNQAYLDAHYPPSYEQAISARQRSSLNARLQNVASSSNLRNSNQSRRFSHVSIQSQQQGR